MVEKTEYNKVEVVGTKVDGGEEEVQERSKQDKVVSIKPIKKKKGLFERLVVGMLGPDGLPAIGDYLNKEIVIPAVKNIIVDSITSGINMAMFGDGRGVGPRTNTSRPAPGIPPRTNYANRYTPTHAPTQMVNATPVREKRNFVEEYIISDRNECETVLYSLMEQADAYDTVSVADYYDLIGVESAYTDNTYGWTVDVLSRASIVAARGGWVIKLPSVQVI